MFIQPLKTQPQKLTVDAGNKLGRLCNKEAISNFIDVGIQCDFRAILLAVSLFTWLYLLREIGPDVQKIVKVKRGKMIL